jgi:hypothetical protein
MSVLSVGSTINVITAYAESGAGGAIGHRHPFRFVVGQFLVLGVEKMDRHICNVVDQPDGLDLRFDDVAELGSDFDRRTGHRRGAAVEDHPQGMLALGRLGGAEFDLQIVRIRRAAAPRPAVGNQVVILVPIDLACRFEAAMKGLDRVGMALGADGDAVGGQSRRLCIGFGGLLQFRNRLLFDDGRGRRGLCRVRRSVAVAIGRRRRNRYNRCQNEPRFCCHCARNRLKEPPRCRRSGLGYN